MPEFTFLNVIVSIEADNAQAAYDKLCEHLSVDGIEYETDTYKLEENGLLVERDTEELFGED